MKKNQEEIKNSENLKNSKKSALNLQKMAIKTTKIKKNAKNCKSNKNSEEKNSAKNACKSQKIKNNKNQETGEKLSLRKKITRTLIVFFVLAVVMVLGYYVLIWTGAWEYINSVEKIRQLILSLGFWGRLAFVLIQFLQVTFLPIPSTISTLAGVLIYGPLQAALLSLAGILLGSVLAFWLGRYFGKRLVTFMVGEQTCEKWTKFLTDAKYSFFVMMMLPMFPDDILCLVAGLTNMSWAFFVTTNLISRPIGVFLTCYVGSGSLIPYHGWGLFVWAVIVVLVAVALFLSYKYRDQIENFLKERLSAKKHKTEKSEKP